MRRPALNAAMLLALGGAAALVLHLPARGEDIPSPLPSANEDLKVVGIGGQSYRDPTYGQRRRRGTAAASRQYRKITVELPPDVSLQLTNVLTHVRGNLWIEVRNPTDAGRAGQMPEINRDLRDLKAAGSTGPARIELDDRP